MSDPEEQERIENTRRLFKEHKGKPKKEVWYHSVLDPEAKVIYNDKGEMLIRDKKLWQDFVSNTYLNPPKKNKK